MTRVNSSTENLTALWVDPEIAVQLMAEGESSEQRKLAHTERQCARTTRDAALDQEADARRSASVARLVGGLINAASTAGQAIATGARAGELATQACESRAASDLHAASPSQGQLAASHEQAAGLAGARATRNEAISQGAGAAGQAGNAIGGYVADGAEQSATEERRRADRAKDRADDANQSMLDATARGQRILERAAQGASDQSRHRDAMIANIRA